MPGSWNGLAYAQHVIRHTVYAYFGSRSLWCFFTKCSVEPMRFSILKTGITSLSPSLILRHFSITVSVLKQYALNTILMYTLLATACESHHWSTSMINVDHQTILLSTNRLSITRYLVNAVNAVSCLMLSIGKGWLYDYNYLWLYLSWLYH